MSVLWLDGRLFAAADARIAPDDRGLLLGDGLFETIRLRAGLPCHIASHLARLRDGAALLRLPVRQSDAELVAALSATAAANRLVDGSFRLTLTRGAGPRGLTPPADPVSTLLIAAFAATPAPGPARLVVCAGTRRNALSPLSRIKSLNYGDSILARIEATERGADDALLLNGAGRLACAGAANVLVHLGGRWLTPPVSEGALPGIARGRLFGAGLCTEAPIEAASLAARPPILLCNSLSLREARWLDGDRLGRAESGAIRALLA